MSKTNLEIMVESTGKGMHQLDRMRWCMDRAREDEREKIITCQSPDADGWISVEERLPEKRTLVLCKIERLSFCTNDYAVGYLISLPNKYIWLIEGHHVTHYTDAVNTCVTKWKPIEPLKTAKP